MDAERLRNGVRTMLAAEYPDGEPAVIGPSDAENESPTIRWDVVWLPEPAVQTFGSGRQGFTLRFECTTTGRIQVERARRMADELLTRVTWDALASVCGVDDPTELVLPRGGLAEEDVSPEDGTNLVAVEFVDGHYRKD